MRCKTGGIETVTAWVDNLLLFTDLDESMSKVAADMHGKFDLTNMGEPSKIVGIEITQDEDSVTISQTKYIEAILEREGMRNAHPVKTPCDHKISLIPNREGGEGNRSNSYAQLIGSLMYLTTATRPDITFAVYRLAAFTANLTKAHENATKRILQYLAGTKHYGITHRRQRTDLEGENLFYGYTDAGYGNQEEYRLTSGYTFISGGGAITWGSRKQISIALSSTEAEYVALSEATREALWLKSLYEELGFIQRDPILILGDNNGSIAMAKNPQFHKRSKQIAICWHFVREKYQEKAIEIFDVRDPQNTADILTKALTPDVHSRHTTGLGLHSA